MLGGLVVVFTLTLGGDATAALSTDEVACTGSNRTVLLDLNTSASLIGSGAIVCCSGVVVVAACASG